jgi:hypothetical protein
MAESRSVADQRAAEEREQQQLEQFLAHAARIPELQTRLRGVDPYEVVEIAAAKGYRFGVFTLHRAVCTGYAMPKVQQGALPGPAKGQVVSLLGGSPPSPTSTGRCWRRAGGWAA